MRLNMVVVKAKFINRLLQRRFRVDLNVADCAFEGAEKAFDTAVLPRRMRVAFLMSIAERFQACFKLFRHKCAVIVSTNRFGLAESCDQAFDQLQNASCAFVDKTQRQIFAAAVIDHADQKVRAAADVDVSKIQRPDLIRAHGFGRFLKIFAQAQPFVARFLFQLCDKGLTHRFAPADEFGIKGSGDSSTAGIFHQRQQPQHLGFHPARLAVIFGAVLALLINASTAQAVELDVRARGFVAFWMQQQDENRQQNQKVERAAEGDWHGFSARFGKAGALQDLVATRVTPR